jgi:hypothetical protein
VLTKQWEFGYGKSKWKPYDPTQNKNLSKAFCSGKKSFVLSILGAECTVKFDQMVQRKTKSGWVVAVRCKSSDPAESEKCMPSSFQFRFLNE